jgi:hypothetical protein
VNYVGAAAGTLVISTAVVVRHAPSLNGALLGSVQMVLPEDVTVSGHASVSGDLLVPGTPNVRVNGTATYAGTLEGGGSAAPTDYTVTLTGGAVLRSVVRRTDAVAFPVVPAPPEPTGSRDVVLHPDGDGPGDFATIRNLTVTGNVGPVVMPPGTYGTLVADGTATIVIGTPNATQPAVYNLQELTLNGSSTLEVVGPVILTVGGGVTLNGAAGNPSRPDWLMLNVETGGVTVNAVGALHGFVVAPAGAVTIGGVLTGRVISDRLVIRDGATLTAGS